MNYLGHAFLSFGDAEILTGNMIGDHVKGLRALEGFPPVVKKGILLHRKIDAFTDTHPAIQRAKVWFKPDYGLYAGALMDSLFDHYLANDARYFPSNEYLQNFTQDVYGKLASQQQYFPPKFAGYFPHMREHNWLYHYKSLQGMKRSLTGLERRAKYMPPPDKAYEIFVAHYYFLFQCYYDFIDDVVRFVKVELSK